MNVFSWCLCGFLMILGLAQLWEALLLWWYRPKLPLLRYEVVPLSGQVENGEQLLPFLRLTTAGRQLLLLDFGLDSQSRNLLRQLCSEQGACFLTPEEAEELLFEANDLV